MTFRSHRLKHLFFAFLVIFSLQISEGYDNGLGLTPPMGWNSWNRFNCDIREDLIQEMAQAMIDLELDKVGYSYINLDDCWQHSRNASGFIVEDPNKFPSGIPALREYVHSLGLKFGLYSSAGILTCARRPGGLGFETKDAAIYAEWEIDYLKYDNCYSVGVNVHTRYQRMHEALNATGHPIFFSLCEWGYKDPATWAAPVGNSWRTTGDISPVPESIFNILDINNKWHEYAGPGGWNDPDMLEVGNGKLTISEQRSHFTLWCLMKAPLLLGNDLRDLKNNPDVLSIITNKEIITWNQDPHGIQGYRRWKGSTDSGDIEVWAGELFGGELAVVLFNRSSQPQNITAHWKDLGLEDSASFRVRNLWAMTNEGTYNGEFSEIVGSHDVVAIQLFPVQTKFQTVSNLRRAG